MACDEIIHKRSIVFGSFAASSSFSSKRTLTRPWLLTCGTSSTGYFLTLFCAICFFHGQFSSFCHVRSKEDETLDPLVFTWSPRGQEVGKRAHCPCLCWDFIVCF